MNRIKTVCYTALLVLIFSAGCAPAATGAPFSAGQENAASGPPSSSGSSQAFSSSDPDAGSESAAPAVYRGTIRSILQSEDGTHLTLEQAEGTDFGAPSVRALITPATQTDFELEELKEGVYLEIHFLCARGFDFSSEIPVESARNLRLSEMRNYNGELLEFTPDEEKPGCGTLLMKALDSDFTFLFFYTENTQFFPDPSALKPGDRLNIFRAAAATMTSPPQGAALEVRYYANE